MPNPVILEPVPGDDPCGPDLRWEQDFLALAQTLQNLNSPDDVISGTVHGEVEVSYANIADDAEALCARTKDLRVLGIHAEARWRDKGFAAFAEAVEDLAAVVETWPDPDAGVHPRADPEDGDLLERAAPLAELLGRIPALAATVGFGKDLTIAQRFSAASSLRVIFDQWESRFEPAFGMDLPSAREAWKALQDLLGGLVAPPQEHNDAEEPAPVTAAIPEPVDAWDTVERAAELMSEQDRHSPALPVLRMLSSWRTLGIMEIATAMKKSGVSLEQLLESIRKQST